MPRKITQIEFDKKNMVIGAMSSAKYIGSHKKVVYVCSICSKKFMIAPAIAWYNKQNTCSRCSGNGKISQKEFIRKNNKIGAISYAMYKGNKVDIPYICAMCGTTFLVRPNTVWTQKQIHCYICGKKHMSITQSLTQKEFQQNNKKVNAVSYALYIGYFKKISYICTECGKAYYSSPSEVWRCKRITCNKCSKKRAGKLLMISQHKFEEKNKALGAISNEIYTGSKKLTKYICTRCGREFTIKPNTVWSMKVTVCGNCQLRKNGILTSNIALTLKQILPSFFIHNYNVKYKDYKICIDWAGVYKGYKIAIEYDEWYWHGYKQKEDYKRAQRLIKNGWKVLRIKAHNNIPSINQINIALNKLINNTNYTFIKLKGWGKGKTFANRKCINVKPTSHSSI